VPHPGATRDVAPPEPGLVRGAVAAARRLDLDAGVWWPAVAGASSPVRPGRPPDDVLARAAVVVTLTGDGPPEPLLGAPGDVVVDSAAGTVRPTRATGRAQRVARMTGGDPARLAELLFGRRDLP
jgi:hypothetical protein